MVPKLPPDEEQISFPIRLVAVAECKAAGHGYRDIFLAFIFSLQGPLSQLNSALVRRKKKVVPSSIFTSWATKMASWIGRNS